jgi:hypothetical protein
MTDETPPLDPIAQAEAARTRRRWLTLAEILGVAAVLISALTLWNNYQQRAGEEAEKAAARQEASVAAQTLLLLGTPDRESDRLILAPADPGQTVQDQRIMFPAALGVAAVETVSEPRIEARWFEQALLRARGREEDRQLRGDARLPIAIMTTFFADGRIHRDLAVYDVGYRIEGGGLLSGRQVRLRGLARVETAAPARAQRRLDALWRARGR